MAAKRSHTLGSQLTAARAAKAIHTSGRLRENEGHMRYHRLLDYGLLAETASCHHSLYYRHLVLALKFLAMIDDRIAG